MPSSCTSLEGHVIQANTTVSSGLHCTAMGKEVSLPSGTSSPQHSTTLNAPNSLKISAASEACLMYASRLAVGTAATKPSTYFMCISVSCERQTLSSTAIVCA